MPPLSSQRLLQIDQLLECHKQFLARAKADIKKEITEGPACDSFLTRMLCQLEEHTKWLARENSDLPPRWGRITARREPVGNAAQAIVMRITGPGEDDMNLITVYGVDAASTLEIKVQTYDRMSLTLARAATQASGLLQLQQTSNGSTSADKAAKTHIALLNQYNDVRDVSQQLIGIIADSRGLPVHSLYEDDAFGVGVDD